MTTKQLKARIAEALEDVPASALEQVWSYLSEVRGKSDEELKQLNNLSRILREDAELLEKLAR